MELMANCYLQGWTCTLCPDPPTHPLRSPLTAWHGMHANCCRSCANPPQKAQAAVVLEGPQHSAGSGAQPPTPTLSIPSVLGADPTNSNRRCVAARAWLAGRKADLSQQQFAYAHVWLGFQIPPMVGFHSLPLMRNPCCPRSIGDGLTSDAAMSHSSSMPAQVCPWRCKKALRCGLSRGALQLCLPPRRFRHQPTQSGCVTACCAQMSSASGQSLPRSPRSAGSAADMRPWEVPFSDLAIHRPVGEGSFGQVGAQKGPSGPSGRAACLGGAGPAALPLWPAAAAGCCLLSVSLPVLDLDCHALPALTQVYLAT